MSSKVKPAIVLVHGAWHVPEHYSDFIQHLQHAGFEVYCPRLPTCDEAKRLTADMFADAQVVRDQVISLIDKSREVIMLLHSYGGAVGTEAAKGLSARERATRGLKGGVVHLIYMCGFMLQVGECVGGASLPRPDPDPVESDAATNTTFLCEPPIQLFYADVEPERAKRMERLLTRQSGKAMTDAVTYPAWQHILTTYLMTQEDQVLFPDWQERQIKAVRDAGARLTVETFKSSHSPFLSMPVEMVAAVERAWSSGKPLHEDGSTSSRDISLENVMGLPTLIGAFLFSPLVSAAALLPPSTPPKYILRASQTLPVLLSPSNITNTFSSSSNALLIQCNANYGRHLNPGSCRDVFTYIKKSDEQYTYSERHTGRPNDLPLPHRTLSNDGLCFLQPLLVPGAVTAKASMTQIGQAAYVLFQACVVKKGLGGIAADIGGDNNLNVVIADYAPHVRCDKSPSSGPPWKSCLALVADMEATRDRQVFGDKNRDPRVEVNVPYFYKAIDARCQLSVEITGKSTSASWYEIWEAVSALTAMCVRDQGKGGKAFGIGLRKNIFVKMSDENPDLSHPTASVANVSAMAPLLSLNASDGSSGSGQPDWAPAHFIEVSTGLVQGSGSLSIVSGDVTS